MEEGFGGSVRTELHIVETWEAQSEADIQYPYFLLDKTEIYDTVLATAEAANDLDGADENSPLSLLFLLRSNWQRLFLVPD
jgi:hypothetical protein